MRHLNRKGQNTAEYAILIAVVIGAIVAMQLYVKRGLQGKVKAATDVVGTGLVAAGIPGLTTVPEQYEPYYNESNYDIEQDQSVQEQNKLGGQVARNSIAEKTIRTGTSTTGVDITGDDAWK